MAEPPVTPAHAVDIAAWLCAQRPLRLGQVQRFLCVVQDRYYQRWGRLAFSDAVRREDHGWTVEGIEAWYVRLHLGIGTIAIRPLPASLEVIARDVLQTYGHLDSFALTAAARKDPSLRGLDPSDALAS